MENLEMRNDSPVPRPRLPPLLVPFHIPFLSRFLNDSPVQQDSSLASSRAPPARPPARLLFGRGALPSPRPRIRQSLLASSFFHVSHSQSMCLDHSEQTNQKYGHLRRRPPDIQPSSFELLILLFRQLLHPPLCARLSVSRPARPPHTRRHRGTGRRGGGGGDKRRREGVREREEAKGGGGGHKTFSRDSLRARVRGESRTYIGTQPAGPVPSLSRSPGPSLVPSSLPAFPVAAFPVAAFPVAAFPVALTSMHSVTAVARA